MWDRVAQTTAVVVGVVIVSIHEQEDGMNTKGNTDRIPEMVFFVLLRCSAINNTNVDTLLFSKYRFVTSFSVPS